METRMLLENIYALMDFSIERSTPEFVIDEFKGKYLNSYVSIDNTPVLLVKINTEYLLGVRQDQKYYLSKNHIIKNLTLKPGLYKSNNGKSLYYVYKYPQRQFCKGIQFGVTHNISYLVGDKQIDITDISFIGHTTIFNQKAFIYNKHVGNVTDHTLTLFPMYSHLKLECEELWKQYKII